MFTREGLIALGVVGLATSAAAFGSFDFGLFRDHHMNAHSEQLFGIVEPVEASSTESIGGVLGEQDPTALVTIAKGLQARVLSARANLGANIDMMALWPNDSNPTHLIACNEQGTTEPGVQRIRLSDGFVETIVTGTSSCDPVKRTEWGSVIIGEEVGGTGWVFELINPLQTSNVTFDRVAGTFSGGVGAANLATRPALGHLAFEGLALLPNYRPEDAEIDPGALAQGLVRFCGNNTGNEIDDHNWGETVCLTDGTLAEATANTAIPELQHLVIGTWDFAMMDNLAYQPGRGNWIIHEDGDGPEFGRNNELWSCLDDGDDADTLSDGCARIASLNDLTAEWTGGTFDHSGNHFYVSVQHNATGHGVILDITGWR
jgi:secreted PhoX family phosphatase